MKKLQKMGRSILIPISCLPICGILMGIGYLLCPAGMQGGEIIGFWARLGFFLSSAGGAVINNMPILLAIGIGVGMSDGEGVAGLAALVSWLMITTLLSDGTVSVIFPALAENETVMLAFSKTENAFIGILAGLIGSTCVNRFSAIRLASWLSFFSGKRLGIIMAGLVSIGFSGILVVLWPLFFSALVFVGRKIADMGYVGSAIYVTLNRLLLPFGLHHALNSVFWFDTIGIGDLTAFWAGQTSEQVGWSLGIYMTGYFPSMMFGIPAAALAMRRSFKRSNKQAAALLFSAALSAMLCGVTEPFEFLFLFLSPLLYIVYSLLFGVFAYLANISGFRAGFSFSGGLIDLIFSASLPAAQKTLLIIPLGAAAFITFYIVFRVMIRHFDIKTPGREDDENGSDTAVSAGTADETSRAAGIIHGLGGRENIISLTNCATRLRFELRDSSLCDDAAVKKAGSSGVIKFGSSSVHVIIGLDVEFVAAEIKHQLTDGVPATAAEEIPAPISVETVIHGKAGSSGIAVGAVFLKKEAPLPVKNVVDDTEAELRRFDAALTQVKEKLSNAASSTDAQTAGILGAQALMLEDEALLGAIREKLHAGMNAEYASWEAGNELAESLAQADDAYLKARAADVRDVAGKLSRALMGHSGSPLPEAPCILVAEELSPEELAGINRKCLLGIVTRGGSAASHTAILAGNYGIPYLFAVNFDAVQVASAEFAALDTESGSLILSPNEETIQRLTEKKQAREAMLASAEGCRSGIELCANITTPEDVDAVLSCGADGIGLFRTEYLYMNRSELPDEEEQFRSYRTVLERMQGKKVIIRTMDIGADKVTDCLRLPQEQNPALGRRAIRICLEEPELFRTQLRALLRAAVYGDEYIMYPMITSVEELDDIREQVALSAQELEARHEPYRIPPQGIMIETPAAAVISDILAEKVDFFSIGTNDLTQYTIALDRQAQGLDRFYRADHKALLRLMEFTVKNAHEKGIWVGVCGELGGDTRMIAKLRSIGVDELSMSAPKLREVRAVLASLPAQDSLSSEKENFTEPDELCSPADGILIPMEALPDPAFASGSLGKCVGVLPENGNIYAPCSGTVTMVAPTFHAIGIRTRYGRELLLHIGIDTFSLGGRGFECFVKTGDEIKRGDRLLTVDLDVLHRAGLDPTVILAVHPAQ